MRIMGLDVGSKTVGVAVSDPLGFTAQGLEIIQIDEDKKRIRFGALGRISGSIQGRPFCFGLAEKHEQHQRTACGSQSGLWHDDC